LFNKNLKDKITLLNQDVEKLNIWKKDIEQKLTPEKIQALKDPSLVTSPDGRFKIRIEKGDRIEKDYIKMHTSLPILTGNDGNLWHFVFPYTACNTFNRSCPDHLYKTLNDIYKIQACIKVMFSPFGVSIVKTPAVSWDEILPRLEEIIFNFLVEKYPLDKE